MKKTFAALSLCFSLALALAAPGVHAQQVASAPVAASTAPANPAALAAAKDMLLSMNYRATASSMLAQMRQSIPAMVEQGATAAINGNPKLDAAQKKEALAKMKRELPQVSTALDGVFLDPSMLDDMMQATADLYARYFTVDELRQIAVFYKTPVGAKMLATMPQLMNESMQVGQRIVTPRINAIMQKMQTK